MDISKLLSMFTAQNNNSQPNNQATSQNPYENNPTVNNYPKEALDAEPQSSRIEPNDQTQQNNISQNNMLTTLLPLLLSKNMSGLNLGNILASKSPDLSSNPILSALSNNQTKKEAPAVQEQFEKYKSTSEILD